MELHTIRQQDDQQLRALLAQGGADGSRVSSVLSARARAARHLRLVMARMYGRAGQATHQQWHILPCLTAAGTVGVLDTAAGTAWDSGVPADPGVEDLGLGPAGAAFGAANGIGGDVRIAGELVQRDGATPGAPIAMPAGWRQVAVPTWRGYEDGPAYVEVPSTEYRPETWIRPQLAAAHLVTCYGRAGESDGEYLTSTHGWDANWPWGVPPWVQGESASVLDELAAADGFRVRVRLPRGTDAEETQRMALVVAHFRRLTAASISAALRPIPDEGWSLRRADRELLGGLVYLLEETDDALPEAAVEPALRLLRKVPFTSRGYGADGLLGTAAQRIPRAAALSPWDVARVIGWWHQHLVAELIAGLFPRDES